MTEQAASQRREVVTGALVTLACSALFGAVLPLFLNGFARILPLGDRLSALSLVAPVGIGVVQFAWVVPLYRSYQRQGKDARKKGVVITAAITFLLNATCWGVLTLSLSNATFH